VTSRDVRIRRARPNDADAIANVIASADPDVLVSEIDREERRERIRWLLETEQNIWFVAELGGAVVGELGLALQDPGPACLGLSVTPSKRRLGIAAALLAEATRWAEEHDVHKIAADVFPENDAALALLRKHGFQEEGHLKRHYRREHGEARDAVVLGRLLV
jgi:RimJ/RimL family protein N-acetyltransferase